MIDAALRRGEGGLTARREWLPRVVHIGVAVAALAVWALSLRRVDLAAMSDVGLVSALPAGFFVALAALSVSFCVALHRPHPHVPTVALHVLALIVMLYGVTAVIEEAPRFPVTWRHVGVTEYIARTGGVDPTIDAYFNWPGFFILSAFVTEAAGLASAITFAEWFPVVLNVLYAGPLLVILRSATTDGRLVWFAIWIFYLANWIGQDYFSPQALFYFIYLTVIAVILHAFTARDGRLAAWLRRLRFVRPTLAETSSRDLPPEPSLSAMQRAALMAFVILLFASIVPSHQLTPFFTIAALASLVATGMNRNRLLPLLMIVFVGAWVSFMATAYFGGHLEAVTGQVGQVNTAVGANVGGRLRGNPEHLLIVYLRLGMTGALWAIAFVGGLRLLRQGRLPVPHTLLAMAPFPLIIIQPYGGEMLLRVYLFAVPFMALLVASLFYPTSRAGRSWWTAAAVTAATFTFLAAFLFTRYGNERMDYFTQLEVDAVARMYEVAPPGSLLIAASGSVPWKYQDYEKHDYEVLLETDWFGATRGTPGARSESLVSGVRELMQEAKGGAYLIITRSQKAEVDLLGLAAPYELDRLERNLAASPSFDVVYANGDAKVFGLAGQRP